ncbi:MAG TPA: hypothetical protein PKM21_16015 [Anaerolineales bacterium]|nr:hypothetical protein [Anaerolineales bacterium]
MSAVLFFDSPVQALATGLVTILIVTLVFLTWVEIVNCRAARRPK